MNLGDIYQQAWKRRSKPKSKPKRRSFETRHQILRGSLKGSGSEIQNGQNHKLCRPSKEITSTLFVPPTAWGKLTELIKEEENR